MQKGIVIDHINMTYTGIAGSFTALRDINLTIEPREFICIAGPSGCGKTTLLNILAGFIEPTSGHVYIDDREIREPGPDRGVVFQQYAVFPWLTVPISGHSATCHFPSWCTTAVKMRACWSWGWVVMIIFPSRRAERGVPGTWRSGRPRLAQLPHTAKEHRYGLPSSALMDSSGIEVVIRPLP